MFTITSKGTAMLIYASLHTCKKQACHIHKSPSTPSGSLHPIFVNQTRRYKIETCLNP